MTDTKERLILLGGDWLALALFVFLGQMEHELVGTSPLSRLLTTAAVILLPWMVMALLTKVDRVAAGTTGRAFLGRSLLTWLAAAPLALLLRAYLQGQATIIVIFMAITIGLGGLFLLGWRALYLLIRRRFHTRSKTNTTPATDYPR